MLYDVIIIGGGPAGLECARVLMDSKLSVLIVEKNKRLGPKTCAGGIVQTVEPLHLPELKLRSFDDLKIDINTKPYRFKSKIPIKILDRDELGHYQEQLLAGAKNVAVLTGTMVRKINSGRIDTTAGDFGYRCLVGADGSTSIVRRYLKLGSRYTVGSYYNIAEPKDRLVFHLNGASLKTGYIWEFPHQGFTNVGVYYNPERFKTRDAIRMLRDYMRRKKYPIDSATYRAFPINYLYKGCRFKENIFLAGDAAGLASKLTGEGIAGSMISGREIARKIKNPKHDLKSLDAVIAHKQRQDYLINLLEKFPIGLNAAYYLLFHALKFHISTQ